MEFLAIIGGVAVVWMLVGLVMNHTSYTKAERALMQHWHDNLGLPIPDCVAHLKHCRRDPKLMLKEQSAFMAFVPPLPLP